MALSDELAKVASERYALIKIVPALRLNTFLTLKAGTTYQAVLTNKFEVDSVKVDGTAYTVSATVNPAINTYYYDSTTGVFEINFNAAIGTKQAILFFVLRFTDSEFGVFDENGVKNGAVSYQWQCRLDGSPSFDVSVKDMIAGVASISSSIINIENTDGFMNSYLGGEYSYSNKAFTAILCINALVSSTFNGSIKELQVRGNNVSLRIYDSFYKLNEPATMGNLNSEIYVNYSGFANASFQDIGKTIPYVFGVSSYKYLPYTNPGQISSGQPAFALDYSNCPQALCTDATIPLWTLYRSSKAYQQLSYANVTSITNYGNVLNYGTTGVSNAKHLRLNFTTMPPYILIGDPVPVATGGVKYYGTIFNIGDTYADVIVTSTGGILPPAGAYTIASSPPSTSLAAIGIIVEQNGNVFLPAPVDDYTLSFQTLSDTTTLVWQVNLLSMSTTDHPGLQTITAQNTRIFFRSTEDRSSNRSTHGYVIRRILEASGASVNASSFTTADSDLVANVNMMIPDLSEKLPRDYVFYLGKLTASTFGYLYNDTSTALLNYKLFSAPASGSFVHGNMIIDLSVSFSQDQMSQSIRAYNDANYYQNSEFTSTPPSVISTQLSSTKSSYLHSLTNQISQESVLALPYYTAFRRIDYASNMQMFVILSLASNFANLNIGDDLSVYDDRIPGDKVTVNGYSCSNLKIIGIEYSPEKIIFTTTDLRMS
jgi:hypothetical protein